MKFKTSLSSRYLVLVCRRPSRVAKRASTSDMLQENVVRLELTCSQQRVGDVTNLNAHSGRCSTKYLGLHNGKQELCPGQTTLSTLQYSMGEWLQLYIRAGCSAISNSDPATTHQCAQAFRSPNQHAVSTAAAHSTQPRSSAHTSGRQAKADRLADADTTVLYS